MTIDRMIRPFLLILTMSFFLFIFNAKSVNAISCVTSWNGITQTTNTLISLNSNTFIQSNILSYGTCETSYIYLAWSAPYSSTISYSDTLGSPTANEIEINNGQTPPVNVLMTYISNNEISFVFNGITHQIYALGTNSVAGTWGIGFYQYDPADATPSNSPTTNIILDSVYTPPSTPTLSSCPSATKLDVGQSVSCTASFTGGTSPYTYNWLVVNSITDAVVANMLYTGVTTTSNTFTYTTQSVDTANSPLAFNVIVTDAHPTTVNSVYSSTFAVNTVPSISISPSSATIDNGQSITLTASTSGGTLPISYAWYSGSTCSGTVLSTSASYSPSPSSTTTYCAEATDSATTAETSTSTVTVTVNSALGTPTLSPSTTQTLDNGQSVSFSTSWSGGTSSYTAYLYSSSTSSCSTSSTLVQTVSSATSPTSFTAQSPSSTLYYCSAIKDSASTPETTTSSATEVKVNSALGTPTISPSSATYDTGQTITLTASISGGTSSYSYQWYNDTSGTATAISGATSSTLTETAGSTAETVKYYVKVTDSATTPESTTSSTESYIINTALSSGSPTPSSPTIDNGQSITLTSNPSGGTTPYSYQWYSGTSSTCSSDTAISGATSSTYTASPTSSTYYCYKVTDSATTPTSVTSGTDLVTVNTALGTPSISPTSAETFDYGQSITFSSSWSGGTSTYTANWIVVNSITGTQLANALYTGISSTSNTFVWAFPSADTGNTVQGNVSADVGLIDGVPKAGLILKVEEYPDVTVFVPESVTTTFASSGELAVSALTVWNV